MPTRRAHTLLELVLATSLTAVAVVPALALMRDSMALSRTVETRNHLTTLCASKLEEHLALAAADWTIGTFTGTFSAMGYANLRFEVVHSDEGAAGGIPNRLMVVTATVWQDNDADGVADPDESKQEYYSKVAKLALYQEETGG